MKFMIAILSSFTLLCSSFAFAANPTHPASDVTSGTFASGNFVFPLDVQIEKYGRRK